MPRLPSHRGVRRSGASLVLVERLPRLAWFGLLVLAVAIGVSLSGCQRSAPAVTAHRAPPPPPADGEVKLLNVSYDPTRELYRDINAAFAEEWQAKHHQRVSIEQSHGGSGKQARAVMDGLEADVVTLALSLDIDQIATKTHLLPADWQSRLPHQSAPYTSTIVFLVRRGNPKQIRDWPDLAKPDVQIITPNPKTGGGARWNYLAAWGFVLQRELGDLAKLKQPDSAEVQAAQRKAQAFVGQLFGRVPVLDSGARGSTTTFVEHGLGDVLLTWENEAFLAVKELGPDKVELVTPSVSILAQPSVAVVEQNAARHGTRAVAQAYLEFLYTPTGQKLIAQHGYRPVSPESAEASSPQHFAQLHLFTIDAAFGGWASAQRTHFADGGVFDTLYHPG